MVPLQAHVWPDLVVEVQEFLERLEPTALLLVGPVDASELAVRLGLSNLAEGEFDIMLVEIALEGVVEAGPIVLPSVDGFRAVIGDDLQGRYDGLILAADLVQQLDAPGAGPASATIISKANETHRP